MHNVHISQALLLPINARFKQRNNNWLLGNCSARIYSRGSDQKPTFQASGSNKSYPTRIHIRTAKNISF
jgi:hypothetical protein